jgi:hypothetical protein
MVNCMRNKIYACFLFVLLVLSLISTLGYGIYIWQPIVLFTGIIIIVVIGIHYLGF